MALEDRCSPQNATSPPPGVLPHSPQSNHTINSSSPTASMLMLINNVIDTKTKLMEGYCDSKTELTPSQLLSTLASKNLFNINGHQLKFPQPMLEHGAVVKREDDCHLQDDDDEEDDEIDIENDTPKISTKNVGNGSLLVPSPSPSCSSTSSSPLISSATSPKSMHTTNTTNPATNSGNLKFSISQILSDSFGNFDAARHHLQQQQQHHRMKITNHHHHPLLFRPYDLDLELRNSSRKLKNNFSNLFNSFSSKKLEEFCDSKLNSSSSISNGLPNHRISGSVAKDSVSTASRASSVHSSSYSRPQDSSGLDSSDDTRSESGGSTKEDNGQGQSAWPAWVYCTRYSDRPSSGKISVY